MKSRLGALAPAQVLRRMPHFEDSLRYEHVLPPRQAEFAEWPDWVPAELRRAWALDGVERPWLHQRAAADLIWSGNHTLIATGTASGKSLGYLMPALSRLSQSRGPLGQRGGTVLYVAPTKALSHDQFSALDRLAIPGLRAATHDGDSSREERSWTRDYAEYVLTNPDMLHHSLLPGHDHWARFFARLRFVVVDECHHYRGVFGAHVALVLRRLRRVAAAHGADPTFVLASATVAEPDALSHRLVGEPVHTVTADASPRGEVTIALWEPGKSTAPAAAALGEPPRRSAVAETGDLLTEFVVAGVRTLAFVRSRRGAETTALSAQRQLVEVDPSLPARVAAYRGGYLPEERRALEQDLRDGRLLGMSSTNALELGIDISGLDAVLLAGFPRTRAAFWQQVGRAGRSGAPALGVLVAGDDPLDTYLVRHPEALFGRPVEATVFDPGNPYVLGPHLCAAAAEVPLTQDDLALFGREAPNAVDALTEAGYLRKRPRGWFWTDRDAASAMTDLRSGGGSTVRIVESSTGRVLGTIDAGAACASAHEGAVYLHQGDSWVIGALHLDDNVAMAQRRDVDYSTSARSHTDISILQRHQRHRWGDVRVETGTVKVTQQVTSYLRRCPPGGEVVGEYPLDLPEQHLTTQGMWWLVPDHVWQHVDLARQDLPGAAHAAEHAAIGLLPLFATCDRWDIGGVSTALHEDTGVLTVFVYDGHPGGAGFARRGFDRARDWLTATRETISCCPCEAGCPACVQSPKCGNQNHPLDKSGALRLLDAVLAHAEAPTADSPADPG